jgi:hypothetical protein
MEGQEIKAKLSIKNIGSTKVELPAVFVTEDSLKNVLEKNGLSIKMTKEYVMKDSSFELFAESADAFFLGNIESKQDITGHTLTSYTNLVLSNAYNKSQVKTYDKNGVKFMYATYEGSSNGLSCKYLLVTLENSENYVTCNFGCLKSNYADYEEDFLDMATSIKLT